MEKSTFSQSQNSVKAFFSGIWHTMQNATTEDFYRNSVSKKNDL
jgi:hypothetical protein